MLVCSASKQAAALKQYWPAAEVQKLPIFLINDFVRYWKTLCLNYEAFRRTDDRPGKLHLSLLKLRYSRMWTCFSGLAFLIGGLNDDAIPRSRAVEMVSMTSVERMLDVGARRPLAHELVDRLLQLYAKFLELTSAPPGAVYEQLEDSATWGRFEASSDEFGQTMHQLMTRLTVHTSVERFLLI